MSADLAHLEQMASCHTLHSLILPVFCVVAGVCSAQESAIRVGREATLLLASGDQVVGVPNWGSEGPTAAAGKGWLAQTWPGAGAEAARFTPATWQLELADDSLVFGRPGFGDGGADIATWLLSSGQVLEIDTLWVRNLAQGDLLPSFSSEQDVLWLNTSPPASPDRRNGWLLGWEPEGLRFDGPAGERLHSWKKIRGLQLLVEEVEMAVSPTIAWVSLLGGGCVRGEILAVDESTLLLRTAWGRELSLPITAVAALFPADFQVGSKFAVTADGTADGNVRTPSSPLGGFDWSPKLNQSVEGNPLMVNGVHYPDGIGTRADTRMALELPANSLFCGFVGIDDETLGFRSAQPARFRIEQAGKVLWSSPVLAAGEHAVSFMVEVIDGGRVELVCEAAAVLPFGAHGDWLVMRAWPLSGFHVN